MSHKFELEDGICICKLLEPVLCEQGLHCALAGSLVYKGWSNKDIDIFIYPHECNDIKSISYDEIWKALYKVFKDRIKEKYGGGTSYNGLIKAEIIGKKKTYIVDFFIINK